MQLGSINVSRFTFGVLAVFCSASVGAGADHPAPLAADSPRSAAGEHARQWSDDPLLQEPPLLQPRIGRSEEDEDKLTATTWFLRGRLAFQREDNLQALKYYERAWRYDPAAVSILREIVPLAFELKHNAVAARYAVIMAEEAPRDSILLRRLAQHLMDERDYGRALQLYEKSLELRKAAGEVKHDAREVLSQMEIARLYFIEEQFGKSAAAFAVVRDALDNPDKYGLSDKIHTTLLGNPRVTYTLFGEAFLEAGRLEEAAEMFEKAFADKASAPLLAFHLARIEMKNGRPQSALEQLNKYLVAKISAAGARPYALLERVLGELNDKDAAARKLRERLEQSYRDDPGNAALAYFLAEKYRQWDELEKAAAVIETARQTEPTIAGAAALIDIYRRQQAPEKLLNAMGAAIELTGSFRPLQEEITKLAADEHLVKQLLRLVKMRQKDAGDKIDAPEALAMGLLAIEAKRYDDADEQLAVAAAADEQRRAAIMENWGLQMFIGSEYERAAKVFQRAIDEKVAPRFDGDFYYYLAAALEYGGHTEAALAAAQNAADAEKDSPRYAARYAWVLYHAKRYDEAEQAYLKLLKQYDEDHSSDAVRDVVREARMILSNIAIHLGRTADAEEWLEQVLDEFPEDIGSLNDLGFLWSDQGKHLRRSLKMIEVAVAGEPDNAAYLDSLGWVHFRLGNYEQAIKYLEQSAAYIEDTPDGVIMDHLGDAYHAAGRDADAARAWKMATELFEKDENTDDAEKTQKKLDDLKKR